MRPGTRPWTQEEDDVLAPFLAQRISTATKWRLCARLGRTFHALGLHLYKLRRGAGGMIRTRGQVRLEHLDPRVLDERDRRSAAAEHRSLTGVLCGDPPPGYSALDRR